MRVRFGDCLLDSETRQLFVRDAEVHLQPKAFQFLELLLQNRPKAVSKEALHKHLWPGTFVTDGTVTSLVAEVRHAIGDDAHEPHFLRTVHRFGYAFSGAAQEIGGDRSKPAAARKSTHWIIWGRQCIPIDAGESVLGRDPGATVFLDDKSVSRRHARLLVSDEATTIEDLGSKNGTFVGDTKVTSRIPLSDGDRLRIGFVALEVRIFANPETTETGADPGR